MRDALSEFVSIYNQIEDYGTRMLLKNWFESWFEEARVRNTVNDTYFFKDKPEYLIHCHKQTEAALARTI